MERKPRVIICQHLHHDCTPAEKFGEFLIYTDHRINIYSIKALTEFKEWLDLVTHASDYILLTGNLLVNSMAVTYMLKRFGRVNVLLYHQVESTYIARTLEADFFVPKLTLGRKDNDRAVTKRKSERA